MLELSQHVRRIPLDERLPEFASQLLPVGPDRFAQRESPSPSERAVQLKLAIASDLVGNAKREKPASRKRKPKARMLSSDLVLDRGFRTDLADDE